jgi:hypothetical protein
MLKGLSAKDLPNCSFAVLYRHFSKDDFFENNDRKRHEKASKNMF